MLSEWLGSLEKFFTISPITGLIASFIAGILTSLSPCIYPLIPITLAIVGTTKADSTAKSFITSLIYVLGICATYTLMGIIAATLGIIFGLLFINPITFLILSIILILMGLCNLGIIKINLSFLTPDIKTGKGKFSLFILGMVSGLAIVPCNFPVLGTILTIISIKHDIIYGSITLFLFSLGYGTILLALGTFTTLLKKIPKQGKWLIIIKNFLGLILLIAGLIFLAKCLRLLIN